MASQILTKGLLLFNLSHSAQNICKEIFVKILICFKWYQLDDHPTSSCPKSKDYKICSLCASLEHTHRECTSSNPKCINCEEGNDHSTLAMSCPFQKQVSKKECQEIIQSTNSHQYSSRYQATHSHSHPAHTYSQVLAHSNSAGHSSSMTSVKTDGGPDIIIPIQSIWTFEKK